ncbi:EF-hand domain-containing protein [Rhizobium lentis]|uniref:EF-hand domain-containing protein n=1 Tax=Rhizobium lentis TaxID=1138194 RepID=UPI001C832128|nr:EF-hand domain-containing protein [Rhizobium lentis]MBX5132698.1 EF-hand domain-containing protein [Rhizobium lentis]
MGTTIPNVILLSAAIAVGSAGLALAQTSGADPHHPADSAQATPLSGMEGTIAQAQGAMPGGSGKMQPGMMAQVQGNTMPMQCMMMQPGETGAMPMQPGMMGGMPTMGMRGSMMKIMFAIADTDGDGALSFEEVTAIHKRIFGSVDANKDGKVTPEEMQTFWGP